MLTRLGARVRAWTREIDPWTDVVGVARSTLAVSTLLTLIFSPTSALFLPGAGQLEVPMCHGVRGLGGFCIAGASHLALSQWIAIAILLVVASGWRPRITGVLHWYVSASFMMNALMVDGGDSVVAVLTALLLPVTLTDDRKWHWQTRRPPTVGDGTTSARVEEHKRVIALTALTMIRVQVAGIYFHAAIAKFAVEEWSNGTALYYFLLNKQFGVGAGLRPLLAPLLTFGPTLAMLTWGVLVLEYALSAGLFASKPLRRWLLLGGFALHGAIMVFQGLVSFSLAMFAALVLYLRPVDRVFAIEAWLRRRRAPKVAGVALGEEAPAE